MILEGFEIENWSCIKKMSVANLPPTGVIVIHGPNRTGKSSAVAALRACLMDYPSSSKSKELTDRFPRGTAEKPVVSVIFTSGGNTYRIKKWFGTNKSEFASKTSTGDWKVETTSAADAHEKTCGYAGGKDSAKGLQQLLWLTQAEFRLPDAKQFDATVQAQFRGILGVLQSPLDDRFIERVKNRWNVWFSGQRKPGKEHDIKSGCRLAENLVKLQAYQKELQESEGKFNEVERLLRQATDLEQAKLDLDRQQGEQTLDRTARQEEHQRSQTRILARQQAEQNHTVAQKELAAALEEQQQRTAVAERVLHDDRAVAPALQKVETVGQTVNIMKQKKAERRKEIANKNDTRRELRKREHRVIAKLGALDDVDRLATAQDIHNRARAIAQDIDEIEKYFAEKPVPEKTQLEMLKNNRQRLSQLQADRDAASMNLMLVPEKGGVAQLALDGGPLRELPDAAAPIIVHPVRRKAELLIRGWGRVEMSRGTGSGDLDQIEEDLRTCHDEFAAAITPLGIASNDPDAFDRLLHRDAEHRLKNSELEKHKKDLKKLAPKGLEPLQRKVVELETKLKDVPEIELADVDLLPAQRGELDALAATVKRQISVVDGDIDSVQKDADAEETNLEKERQKETVVKESLAACKAKANSSCEELERLRTDEQLSQRMEDADRAVKDAETQLKQTELTNDELTIEERLKAVNEAVSALDKQLRENAERYNTIKGRLIASEGLHAQRSSVAARVDELTRLTERESLEKDAVDRLYSLFEECREKQLGTLLGPIHNRVLGWMRALDLGDYKEVRFNDAFLPDKLMSRDGTAEFTLGEESTGAQEQIGMFVRLALGSTLASASEPAIAFLDDPLTHCDIGRLNKMRVILRRAAEGDPTLTPPAGPLQIIILTCHPEWFRDERATVIDLENPDVMSRFPV